MRKLSNAATKRSGWSSVSWLSSVLLLASAAAWSASTEQETLRRLAQLRTIDPSSTAEQIQKHNEQMDEAWGFYKAHKDEAMPSCAANSPPSWAGRNRRS